VGEFGLAIRAPKLALGDQLNRLQNRRIGCCVGLSVIKRISSLCRGHRLGDGPQINLPGANRFQLRIAHGIQQSCLSHAQAVNSESSPVFGMGQQAELQLLQSAGVARQTCTVVADVVRDGVAHD
jgi:hypothetical protein